MTDAERDTAALADVLRKRAPLLETLADGPLTQRDVRDELGFFAYDDGVLVGAAFSDDEDVVRWGERRFERRYERSDPA
jgi:hypothetical protein